MGGKPRSLRILGSKWHLHESVDPFGFFPCSCPRLLVHVTTGKHLGDDLVECPRHAIVVSLGDLFRHIRPRREPL